MYFLWHHKIVAHIEHEVHIGHLFRLKVVPDHLRGIHIIRSDLLWVVVTIVLCCVVIICEEYLNRPVDMQHFNGPATLKKKEMDNFLISVFF